MPVKEDIIFEEPSYAKDALSVIFPSQAQPIVAGSEDVIPEKLIFTESGRYVLVGEMGTKALDGKFTVSGQFALRDGVYTMNGFGSASISGNQVALRPQNGASVQYDATVNHAPGSTSGNESNMVRSWKVDGKIKASYRSATTKLEPDLESIAQYLADHHFVYIDTRLYRGYVISDITMSMADNAFIISFENAEAYVGNWKWENREAGQFNYTFSTGAGLIDGTAGGTVRFYKEGQVNKCDFVMSVSAINNTADLEFTLVEA